MTTDTLQDKSTGNSTNFDSYRRAGERTSHLARTGNSDQQQAMRTSDFDAFFNWILNQDLAHVEDFFELPEDNED